MKRGVVVLTSVASFTIRAIQTPFTDQYLFKRIQTCVASVPVLVKCCIVLSFYFPRAFPLIFARDNTNKDDFDVGNAPGI